MRKQNDKHNKAGKAPLKLYLIFIYAINTKTVNKFNCFQVYEECDGIVPRNNKAAWKIRFAENRHRLFELIKRGTELKKRKNTRPHFQHNLHANKRKFCQTECQFHEFFFSLFLKMFCWRKTEKKCDLDIWDNFRLQLFSSSRNNIKSNLPSPPSQATVNRAKEIFIPMCTYKHEYS